MVLPIVLAKAIDLTGSFAAALVLVAAAEGVAAVIGMLMRETGRRDPLA